MLGLLVWVVRGFGWFAGGLRFDWLDLVAVAFGGLVV